ncbi:MAG TPA: SAV_2336 N-terminal domain-related protein, partial [Kutzneria sp.]|nr:SAV_2336 N-terminal domain-related protein [Kutzneria sp.]
MRLERLVDALAAAQVDVTGEELADAIWLAGFFGDARRVGSEPVPERDVLPPPVEPDGPVATDAVETERRPRLGTRPSPGATEVPASSAAMHLPGRGNHVDGMSALTMLSPAAPALPDTLRLSRALRPLKRRVPDPHRLVVNEQETADHIADTGLWLPEWQPEMTRWLDVALVVDSGPSMQIWRRAAVELRVLLERMGAFRDVRVWEMDTREDEPRLRRPGAPSRSPRELIDPSGRRLVLMLSDCVGEAWLSGAMSQLLALWSKSGSVAIVQTLPQRLWHRTGVVPVPVRLRAFESGLPFRRFEFQPRNQGFGAPPPSGIPVPIMELDPRWIGRWASLLAGENRGWVDGVVVLAGGEIGARPEWMVDVPPDTPVDLVQAFRATASPTAWRLAGYLSTAPLNLPVMRLVQATMLPESGPAHLAEVFLGQLLHRVGEEQPREDPDEVQYDFHKGVRETLLGTLRRDEAVRVFGEVSRFVGSRMGQPLDFAAMLADPFGHDGPRLSADSMAFAQVFKTVLESLGPPYSQAAKRWSELAPPEDDGAPAMVELTTLDGAETAAQIETGELGSEEVERTERMASQICLCYHPRDYAWAEWLRWELDRLGYAVVIRPLSEASTPDGLRRLAAEALENGRYVITVISASTVALPFAGEAWLQALIDSPGSRGRVLAVTVHAGLLLAELVDRIDGVTFEGKDARTALNAIVDCLGRVAARPARTTPPEVLRFPPPPFPGDESHVGEPDSQGPVWVLTEIRAGGRSLLARGGADGAVRLIDVATGQTVLNLEGHTGPVRVLAAIPSVDGGHDMIASGGVDGIVRTWDLDSGALVRESRFLEGEVWALATVRVGGRICLAGTGSGSMIQLWDPESGQRMRTLVRRGGRVWALASVEVGGRELLASGGADGTIRLWDPETSQVLRTIQAHRSTVWALTTIEVNGQSLLASGGADGMIHMWHPRTGALVNSFVGHVSTIRTLAVVPARNGDLLASGSADSTVRLWNPRGTRDGVEHRFNHHTGEVWALAAVEVDGRVQLASGGVDGTIRLADPVTFQTDELQSVRSSAVWALASVLLPNRTLLASGALDGSVHLHELSGFSEERTLRGHRSTIRALASVPGPGRVLLATGSSDGTVRIWDADTGEHLSTRAEHTGEVWTVTPLLVNGERFMASGSADGTIRLWPLDRAEESQVLRGPAAEVVSLAAIDGAGGPLLASADSDGRVLLWDPASCELLGTFDDGLAGVVTLTVVDGR